MTWPSYFLGKISWLLWNRRIIRLQSWSGNFGGDKYLAPYPKSKNDSFDHPFLA
jgi:hypothetical protein